jgi:hypothetical protein
MEQMEASSPSNRDLAWIADFLSKSYSTKFADVLLRVYLRLRALVSKLQLVQQARDSIVGSTYSLYQKVKELCSFGSNVPASGEGRQSSQGLVCLSVPSMGQPPAKEEPVM